MPATVRDLLMVINQKEIYHIPPTASVYETVELMVTHDVSALVVIDDEDRFCGIFTERDCCRRLVLSDKDPRRTKVGEVMTPSSRVVSVEEDNTLGKCLDEMERLGVRHLPVMRNGMPVGIVSMRDIALHYDLLVGSLEKFVSGER